MGASGDVAAQCARRRMLWVRTMFERLGRAVYRLRYLVVVAWVAASIGAVVGSPSLSEVGSADPASFLPREAASLEAQATLERAFPSQVAAGTATIAFWRESGLTDADRATIDATSAWLTGPSAPPAVSDILTGVVGTTGHPELASMLRSADGKLELLQVQLSATAFQPRANAAVAAIRDHLRADVPADLRASVTGSVGIGADYIKAIATATDRTTLVTIGLVVLVLLLIYRAPLAALVPLLTIGASYLVGSGILAQLGQAGWPISSLLGTFVVVIVFGVGTDYTIFLISRFREEVAGKSPDVAVAATLSRIGAVLAASAATVMIGLGSMVVGKFGLFQSTGPALAIAIAVTLLAGLTLAPALLAIFGRRLFWPRHDEVPAAGRGFFARLAAVIARRPLVVTIVALVALAVPAIGTVGLRQSFDVLADLPGDSDARVGFEVVATHFGQGRLMPITVVVDGGSGSDLSTLDSLARLGATTGRLLAIDGVSRVESVVAPSGDGTTPDAFRPSAQLATMADSFAIPKDPATGLKKLLDLATTAGLQSASAYLGLVASAYPDVAADAGFAGANADLARMPKAIDDLRTAARVSTQLGTIARLLSLAGATGQQPGAEAIGAISAYFRELVATYPEVASEPAFRDLAAALADPSAPADPVRLATDIGALATRFASRPDALLFPNVSFPAADSTTALRAEIAVISARLPGELRGVSQTFGARADDLFIPVGLAGDAGAAVHQALAAFVSQDLTVTRINVVTNEGPYSAAAFETFRHVRAVADEALSSSAGGGRVRVGGQTAIQADLQATINDDFVRVASLTVLGVLLVLVVLLRSILAPIYLVGTVLLSYLCTLGLMTLIFQQVLGHEGINNFLPLIVFVLLVALGSDYNIFLMSRVREEAELRGTSAGILAASARTGAVITSAGVILAGTFLAMVASPLTVLFQAGAMVAAGVLIDTFVVRTLLVPAITTLLGDAAWWPFGRRTAGGADRSRRSSGTGEPAARPS
jgi:RND superfamily putative drug exporter